MLTGRTSRLNSISDEDSLVPPVLLDLSESDALIRMSKDSLDEVISVRVGWVGRESYLQCSDPSFGLSVIIFGEERSCAIQHLKEYDTYAPDVDSLIIPYSAIFSGLKHFPRVEVQSANSREGL